MTNATTQKSRLILGILVNSERHLAHIVGITKAALAKGHEVKIFTTDEGTRLLMTPEYKMLSELEHVWISYCEYSTRRLKISIDGLSKRISGGNQHQNAKMMHQADKVIVL